MLHEETRLASPSRIGEARTSTLRGRYRPTVPVIQEPIGRDDLLGLVSASPTARGQRVEDVRGEAVPMRARHWPSACVHNSKNEPQPQAATEGPTQALDIEVVTPA